jgi:hypothetical protein
VEEWKPLTGSYIVSSHGRVARLLKPKLNRNGYLMVQLGRSKVMYVHRAVAEAFFGSAGQKHVDHIDHCRTNNHVDNLRYVTRKENMQHAVAMGRLRVGEKHPAAKFTAEDISQIRLLGRLGGLSQQKIAALFETKQSHISQILLHKVWKGIA